ILAQAREILPQLRLEAGLQLGVARVVEALQELDDVGDVTVAAGPELQLREAAEIDDVWVARAGAELGGRRIDAAALAGQGRPGDEEVDPYPRGDVLQPARTAPLEGMGLQRGIDPGVGAGLDDNVYAHRGAFVPVMDH